MSDEVIWDYSKVPSRTWKWFLYGQDDHWIDLEIGGSGLTYIGTDWSIQSGGRYFGGAQSFDEFLRDGPICDMPEDIARELTEQLKKHRVLGGTALRLVHVNRVEDLRLFNAFIHLDDKPIKIRVDGSLSKEREVVFFEGSLEPGDHTIGFVLVFKHKERDDDMQWSVRGEFTVSVVSGVKTLLIETLRDENGTLLTQGREE